MSRHLPLCATTSRARLSPTGCSCHCWFAPPLHGHTWTTARSSVLAPATSRHSPLAVSTSAYPAPLGTMRHRWRAPPVHGSWAAGVPWPAGSPSTSRHSPLTAPRTNTPSAAGVGLGVSEGMDGDEGAADGTAEGPVGWVTAVGVPAPPAGPVAGNPAAGGAPPVGRT